jgi:hypothetical protein
MAVGKSLAFVAGAALLARTKFFKARAASAWALVGAWFVLSSWFSIARARDKESVVSQGVAAQRLWSRYNEAVAANAGNKLLAPERLVTQEGIALSFANIRALRSADSDLEQGLSRAIDTAGQRVRVLETRDTRWRGITDSLDSATKRLGLFVQIDRSMIATMDSLVTLASLASPQLGRDGTLLFRTSAQLTRYNSLNRSLHKLDSLRADAFARHDP